MHTVAIQASGDAAGWDSDRKVRPSGTTEREVRWRLPSAPRGGGKAGEWRDGKRYGEGIATYAPGRNAAPFYDGNWEHDEPVEKYPMSVHAGH